MMLITYCYFDIYFVWIFWVAKYIEKSDTFINDANCLLFSWIFILNILVLNDTEGKTTIL